MTTAGHGRTPAAAPAEPRRPISDLARVAGRERTPARPGPGRCAQRVRPADTIRRGEDRPRSARRHRRGPGGRRHTADNRDKFFSVDGGTNAIALFANGIVLGDGRQASHWKDDLGIGIMDPSVAFGERLDISQTDLRAFDVMGYTVVPEPEIVTLLGLGLIAPLLVRAKQKRAPASAEAR